MLLPLLWALLLAAKVGANVVAYCPDLKPQQGIDLDQVKHRRTKIIIFQLKYSYSKTEKLKTLIAPFSPF